MRRAATMARRIASCAAVCSFSVLAQPAPEDAPGPTEVPRREGLRIDERRVEEPYTVNVLGQPVQLTGSWEYSNERRRNFDLNDARARDRLVLEHELKLEARAAPAANTSVFLQAVGLYDARRTENNSGPQRTRTLERGQTWVKFDRLGGAPWSLQAGRVALLERRSWWWDDDLDALRVIYDEGPWRLDTGLARQMLRLSSADRGIVPTERGVTRWFGQAGWRWTRRQNLELFWLYVRDRSGAPAPGSLFVDEDDTDASDLRARWVGLRASGEWRRDDGGRLVYWMDSALLRGRETVTSFATVNGREVAGGSFGRRLRSNAVDLGATVIASWPLRPSLTAAFARGSGGERSRTLDANFRQTGLHENKARVSGVKRLRVYGELLQPDLSNLAVATLGTGIRFLNNSSAELIWHRYRQIVADTTIAESRLSQDPSGLDRDIGREIDLVVALREWRQAEIVLTLSRLRPGAAFPANRRDPATAIELALALNF